MRFLVDQQLPPRLAEALKASGYDAIHVRDLGLSAAADGAIWAEACRDNAIVISRDEDFFAFTRSPGGARLIWVRLGNCTNADLLARIEANWSEILERMEAGDVLVELRP